MRGLRRKSDGPGEMVSAVVSEVDGFGLPMTDAQIAQVEELRVRGFQLVKYEQRVIEFSQPGSYVVDE